MYNLIKFISKYSLTFLFLFLELIAFALIIQNNTYHKAGFLNSANIFTGSIHSTYASFTSYLHLKQENEKLAAENAVFKSRLQLIEYTVIPQLKSEIKPLQVDSLQNDSLLIMDTVILKKSSPFSYIPSLAISNSINKKLNYIYINKGQNDGVYADMGVTESNGVVGVVVNSSNRYSVVMPLVNEKSSLSVKIKNQGYFGTLKWEHGNHEIAKITAIPNHVNLEKGDTIVTSGYSQIFPKGILIGYVNEAKKVKGNSFLDIEIELAVDFSKINYTYIINNAEAEEIKKIIIE